MRVPKLYTLRETLRALRIARAAENYATRQMEAADWWAEHNEVNDPKHVKRSDRTWEHLLDVIYEEDSDCRKGEANPQ